MIGFLLTCLATAAVTIVVVTIALLCAQWLKGIIAKRLAERTNKKVIFADTKMIVDDFLLENTEKSAEISMDELEEITEKTPYVAIDMDKSTSQLDNYEGYVAEEVNPNFQANMEKREGLLVFE